MKIIWQISDENVRIDVLSSCRKQGEKALAEAGQRLILWVEQDLRTSICLRKLTLLLA